MRCYASFWDGLVVLENNIKCHFYQGTTTEYPATKNDHVDSLQAYTERDTTTEYPASKNGHVDSLQA